MTIADYLSSLGLDPETMVIVDITPEEQAAIDDPETWADDE